MQNSSNSVSQSATQISNSQYNGHYNVVPSGSGVSVQPVTQQATSTPAASTSGAVAAAANAANSAATSGVSNPSGTVSSGGNTYYYYTVNGQLNVTNITQQIRR